MKKLIKLKSKLEYKKEKRENQLISFKNTIKMDTSVNGNQTKKLENSLKTKNKKEKKFECNNCKKTFCFKKNLSKHMQIAHALLNPEGKGTDALKQKKDEVKAKIRIIDNSSKSNNQVKSTLSSPPCSDCIKLVAIRLMALLPHLMK